LLKEVNGMQKLTIGLRRFNCLGPGTVLILT